MDRTTRETRRQSYDAVLPKREKRCRLILETLGAREMTASEITEELVAAGEIPYFMNENRDSIMRMARGAFEERVDYEMDKVIQNILDPNTKATAKRKITLTIELTPDDERRQIQVSVTAKSTLAATNPVRHLALCHRRQQRRARRGRNGAAGARSTEHGRDAAGSPEAAQARHPRISA